MTNPRDRFPQAEGQLDALRLDIKPRVSALSSIADFVENFGQTNGVPEGIVFLVNLEIDELLTNYVKHSLHRVRDPRMEMTLRVFPERVVLETRGHGAAVQPEGRAAAGHRRDRRHQAVRRRAGAPPGEVVR